MDKSISPNYVYQDDDYTQYDVLSRIKVCTLYFFYYYFFCPICQVLFFPLYISVLSGNGFIVHDNSVLSLS